MVGVGYGGKRNALARVSLVYKTTQPVYLFEGFSVDMRTSECRVLLVSLCT